jgi:hypothetical protein
MNEKDIDAVFGKDSALRRSASAAIGNETLDYQAFVAEFGDNKQPFTLSNLMFFLLKHMKGLLAGVPPAMRIHALMVTLVHQTVMMLLQRFEQARKAPSQDDWMAYCLLLGSHMAMVSGIYASSSAPTEVQFKQIEAWADKFLKDDPELMTAFKTIHEAGKNGTMGALYLGPTSRRKVSPSLRRIRETFCHTWEKLCHFVTSGARRVQIHRKARVCTRR